MPGLESNTNLCDQTADTTAVLRIATYYKIMLVWVVVRLVRYLYEVPRGVDQRLAAWPDDWQAGILTKYRHFLALAGEALPS